MRNIETKARVADLERVRNVALTIGAEDRGVQRDTDSYFRVAHGRLKLRVSEGIPGGTLIAYHRPDQSGSRDSDYCLVAIVDPDALKEALSETLGVLVEVRKRRHLFIYGATRIHLDEVDDLGAFIELETLLGDHARDNAEAEHAFLRVQLGLQIETTIAGSYSDLLMAHND
ncbi:MAG: class IV adenylate cyclase [Nitrolancea sp.]